MALAQKKSAPVTGKNTPRPKKSASSSDPDFIPPQRPDTDFDLKGFLSAFVREITPDLRARFYELSPTQKFKVLSDILPYLLPKQSESALSISSETFSNLETSIRNLDDLFSPQSDTD